jgi:MerR family transcriptional regulator, thiopeptide resistance regulator
VRSYSVGEVARLAHVSVRTLHHYDAMGLLSPALRSEAGYRRYSAEDLGRLQQVLFYRELGLPLKEIARVMSDPSFDGRQALVHQRDQLVLRADRLLAMAELIDRTLTAEREGSTMDDEELFEVFGDFDPREHEDEARERWGHTDAYKESARRTARYGKEDWQAIKEEGDRITTGLAALMEQGAPPDDPRAADLAEEHRAMISRWFYPCSPEMHAGLAEMYVADPRFRAAYDDVASGLAQYVHDAILASVARA